MPRIPRYSADVSVQSAPGFGGGGGGGNPFAGAIEAIGGIALRLKALDERKQEADDSIIATELSSRFADEADALSQKIHQDSSLSAVQQEKAIGEQLNELAKGYGDNIKSTIKSPGARALGMGNLNTYWLSYKKSARAASAKMLDDQLVIGDKLYQNRGLGVAAEEEIQPDGKLGPNSLVGQMNYEQYLRTTGIPPEMVALKVGEFSRKARIQSTALAVKNRPEQEDALIAVGKFNIDEKQEILRMKNFSIQSDELSRTDAYRKTKDAALLDLRQSYRLISDQNMAPEAVEQNQRIVADKLNTYLEMPEFQSPEDQMMLRASVEALPLTLSEKKRLVSAAAHGENVPVSGLSGSDATTVEGAKNEYLRKYVLDKLQPLLGTQFSGSSKANQEQMDSIIYDMTRYMETHPKATWDEAFVVAWPKSELVAGASRDKFIVASDASFKAHNIPVLLDGDLVKTIPKIPPASEFGGSVDDVTLWKDQTVANLRRIKTGRRITQLLRSESSDLGTTEKERTRTFVILSAIADERLKSDRDAAWAKRLDAAKAKLQSDVDKAAAVHEFLRTHPRASYGFNRFGGPEAGGYGVPMPSGAYPHF